MLQLPGQHSAFFGTGEFLGTSQTLTMVAVNPGMASCKKAHCSVSASQHTAYAGEPLLTVARVREYPDISRQRSVSKTINQMQPQPTSRCLCATPILSVALPAPHANAVSDYYTW